MQQKTNASVILAILLLLTFIACNQKENKEEQTNTDTTAKTTMTSTMPAYDPAMDPINVEAPFLTLHKDTLGIKLYEVTLKPGDSVGMHTHPDHVLFVAQGGTAKIYLKDGEPQTVDLATGTAIFFPGQSHSGKNVGNTTIKLVVADIYRPRN